MTQAKINKLLANDPYLNTLAKECIADAEKMERKILESVKDLASKMFCVRVEDETPLDRIQYDDVSIYKAMVKNF